MHEGLAPGPTIVATAGIHGNEPAGLHALDRVLATLRGLSTTFRGRLLAVVGHRSALAQGVRYIGRDLNRGWEAADLAQVRRRSFESLRAEDLEQRELLDLFEPILAEATEPVIFLDLHSTSGPGAPFVCMADVIRNRKFAFSMGVPTVLGLEEAIEGSMIGFLCDIGHIGIAVEGGQHDHPDTVEHHMAAIWSVLDAAGSLDVSGMPDVKHLRDKLQRSVNGLPQVIEIRHRHVCKDGDGFVMNPGYSNFQPVKAGEVVARDDRGLIRMTEDGIMMLPRYQGQGEDGFFLARSVRPFWLSMSAQLRRLGADRVLRGLPGVRRHPVEPDTFVVNPRIARFRVIEIFHLLGYRRRRPEDGQLVFSRRRPDAWGPEPLPSITDEHNSSVRPFQRA
ncbi:MAG: succinylglutamate desuccinylase/aspartoacylase family protein [Myxococcota bacterium]